MTDLLPQVRHPTYVVSKPSLVKSKSAIVYWRVCFFFGPGSMQFPYNPLTMRILSNTPPTSIASPAIQSQQPQQPPPAGAPVAQQRKWQSLMSEKYEPLSDSDDWALLACLLHPWFPEERPVLRRMFTPLSWTNHAHWRMWQVNGVGFLFFGVFLCFFCFLFFFCFVFFGAMVPPGSLTGRALQNETRFWPWSTHPDCWGHKLNSSEGTTWAIVKMKIQCKRLFLNLVWFL